ncbi:MAG: nicotinate phosphoribosyltransferase [Chitinispirillaceae bacterium]|nr:nicotinate phosphoribosyltransferase [Chitinispirillaceae bacterium]
MINRKVFPAAPRAMEATGLYIDLYELTMAQAYHRDGMAKKSAFEVSVRNLPPDWGFFIMAGLDKVDDYLKSIRFSENDLTYLSSLGMFSPDFLVYLSTFRPEVKVRALPEGTVFFPGEPVVEVLGPIIDAQVLETYLLNILGFSILEATLAARIIYAASGRPVVDFGLRRAQGPVASLRAARGARMAGFAGTSNVYASELLGFEASGTMAHSFVQSYPTEREAFQAFTDIYGEKSVLLVDTFDCRKGIRIAAEVARRNLADRSIKITGIRIDSGDFVALSRYARKHFIENEAPFLKIFASGGLDEYTIHELVREGAEIDGFGIGTRFATSHRAPSLDIIYKLVEYNGKLSSKQSTAKATLPGRKSIIRHRTENGIYDFDGVVPLGTPGDLLHSFNGAEDMVRINQRLSAELGRLDGPIKDLKNPASYPVRFETADTEKRG